MKTPSISARVTVFSLSLLVVFVTVSAVRAGEVTYLGREIPSSPDWKLEAKGGTESVDADFLVIHTSAPTENRFYRWNGDLGDGKGFQADIELLMRNGITRLSIAANSPDGPVHYTINLYANGVLGGYALEGYRTTKVPGGRLESLQVRLRGGWGADMVVSANEDPKELLIFAPSPAKGKPRPGLWLGDDSNSYKAEAVIRRVVIRR
ncbi:MAG: hypothetical protein ACOYMV_08795 [Verrucomicrobiia bacterium]